jgi:signal transduction histidine kinase
MQKNTLWRRQPVFHLPTLPLRVNFDVRLPLLPRWNSIAARIFAGFVIMGLMTAILGGYGIYVLHAAGDIVADTYDGPLMEINFARAASLGFAQMDKEALRRKTVPAEARGEIDHKIDELSDSFFEDLAIAEQRALGARESAAIARIRQAVTRWNSLRQNPAQAETDGEIDNVSDQIINDFDTLIELTADQSFIERRKAISAISYFRYTSIGLSGLAIFVGVLITALLARRMIYPLTEAAKVADLIALGHLETPIPAGGKDETGTLLRSMTVMQDNIRGMMAREVAQRQSAQSRLIDALESSREGMMLVDAAGQIVAANSQVADFFPTLAPHLVSGADFRTAFSVIRPLLASRGDMDESVPEPIRRIEIDQSFSVAEYQLPDGRWLRLSRGATRDGGFFLFLIDVTEIKEREEHFKEAMQKADAANTAKSHFLANMSHELRTPLNAIIGFSEIISGEMFGSVGNPKYLDYSNDVLRSGRHLMDILNSVLDLAKSDAGKLDLRPESFDVGEVISDCAMMMREQFERAKLRFDVAPLEGPLPVYADPAKLRQILLNLLSNAVKFNEPGGSVSLLARAGEAGMTEFRVEDTGIGMSPADIAVALTPFGQVDSRLSRRYEGTGLGLPLTKALVELHRGAMTIDSAPGRGTTMTIAIPRAP